MGGNGFHLKPDLMEPSGGHWDKLLNFTTGLGIPGADKGASAEYSLVLLQPDQLEAAYRSD